MVCPTFGSHVRLFAAPMLAVVAAFAPRRRAILFRCYTRAFGRRVHGATRLHVDSTCAMCVDLLATHVLMPCELGVCPDCFSMVTKFRTRACPRCDETITHWTRIRHLDMDDDDELKAV